MASTGSSARGQGRSSGQRSKSPDPGRQAERTAAQLTYNEARAALELILAELQASDLQVEEMAALYRRAQAYAERCEQILEHVEQEILLWDLSADADHPPTAYHP
jgi:exodeoxyribonuclease VII small subunit